MLCKQDFWRNGNGWKRLETVFQLKKQQLKLVVSGPSPQIKQNATLQMPKLELELELHRLTCIHEAAHAVLFYHMGFHVLAASVLMPGDRIRDHLGSINYLLENSDDQLATERLVIGLSAGYVAEMLYNGIGRFEGEDVIIKTKSYLQMPRIANAVEVLANLLHQSGEVDNRQIVELINRLGVPVLY